MNKLSIRRIFQGFFVLIATALLTAGVLKTRYYQ